ADPRSGRGSHKSALEKDGERAVAARFDRRQFGATRNAKSPTAAVIALAGRLDNTVSHFIRKFNSIAGLRQAMPENQAEMSSSMRERRAATSITGAWLVLAVAGCSSEGPSKGPPVYPVEGVVKLKGQPVAGADIV